MTPHEFAELLFDLEFGCPPEVEGSVPNCAGGPPANYRTICVYCLERWATAKAKSIGYDWTRPKE